MSNTLYLPLKAKWYEMIENGVKTEEYREIKAYWVQRLCVWSDGRKIGKSDAEFLASNISCPDDCEIRRYEHFDAVRFSYGYTKRTMTFDVKGIVLGKGNPSWGAPNEIVFIIKLGRRVA